MKKGCWETLERKKSPCLLKKFQIIQKFIKGGTMDVMMNHLKDNDD
jgi:hypothetical protein